MSTSALGGKSTDLRRRVMQVGLAAGAGRGLSLALAVLLVFAWIDLVVELPPGLRLGATLLSLLGLVALIGAAAIHAARAATPAALARRLDEVAQTGGQILAGVDLSLHPQPAGAG